MTLLLAIVAGAALGFVFERGDFCFHSTWRRLMPWTENRDGALFKAYLVLLVISTPIVQLLIALDVIDPFVAPLAWGAAIIGGLLFGAGMVIASTCISGMFYKLGNGMLGMVVAIAAWSVGDLLVYRGPLSGLRDRLNENPVTVADDSGVEQTATVGNIWGPVGWIVLVVVGLLVAAYLVRSHQDTSGMTDRDGKWGWLPLGLAAAVVMSGAWLLVRWHGFVYSYGTSGVPSQVWDRFGNGNDVEMWIPLALVSLIPGAAIAAAVSGTRWIRGETPQRYAQLAGGGFVMGLGAAIAGGCNLGHGMVGVPLLSLGSIVATASIIGGVTIASWVAARL